MKKIYYFIKNQFKNEMFNNILILLSILLIIIGILLYFEECIRLGEEYRIAAEINFKIGNHDKTYEYINKALYYDSYSYRINYDYATYLLLIPQTFMKYEKNKTKTELYLKSLLFTKIGFNKSPKTYEDYIEVVINSLYIYYYSDLKKAINFPELIEYLDKSIETTKNPYKHIYSYMMKYRIYIILNDKEKALKEILTARDIAKQNKIDTKIIDEIIEYLFPKNKK